MSNELLTISKIFHESLFRIPDYQRGYSWNKHQLNDYWTDLEQLPEGRDHYTGVLTFESVGIETWSKWEEDKWIISSRKFKPYYIVDGQQRLTTTIILLKNIIDKANLLNLTLNFTSTDDIVKQYLYENKVGTLSKSYIFGYEKDDPSYEYFKTQILEQSSAVHLPDPKSVYIKNLEEANLYFQEKLKHYTNSEIEDLYTKVTQHLVFNAYEIAKEIDVFIAFETMNNRGKPLSTLELLKNRLIYLVSISNQTEQDSNTLRKMINEAWKTIYYNLGRNEERKLVDDKFLDTHLYFFLNNEISTKSKVKLAEIENEYQLITDPMLGYLYRNQSSTFLLDVLFVRKKVRDISDINLPEVNFDFIKKYVESIKYGVEIYYLLSDPDKSNKFSETEKTYLERLGRLRGHHSSRIIFSVFMNEKRSTTQREEFLRLYERFSFISALSKNRFSHNLIENEKIFIEYTTGHVDINKINTFINNTINVLVEENSLSDNINQWFNTGGGYYSWKTVNYFMYEYEVYLKSKDRSNHEKIKWSDFCKDNYNSDYKSIEHIYPQRAKHESWKEEFSEYNTTQKRLLRNSLGNLLALSAPKNSSLSNKSFMEKKGSLEQQTGYAYGSYSENEVALYAKWNAQTILDRGIKLLNFMEERWAIKIGDKEAKKKALGLSFLKNK